MTLNVAQYLAPLNGGQVLSGYVQGVKQGTGITIIADGTSASGTITLNPAGAATLGFLTSSTTPAPVYNWATGPATPQSFLMNDALGNLSWNTDYVPTLPVGQAFPHDGAAVLPAGLTGSRPAPQMGLLRYSTSFNRLEWSNGSAWLPLSPNSGGLFSFISNVTPTANAPGDFWLDTTTNQEKVWDGVSWVPTTPLATTLIPGRVKIGSNIQIAGDGTISVLPVSGVAGSVSNLGLTTITDNVSSLSIDSALSAKQGTLLQQQINALLIANNLTFAGLISGAGLMTYVTPEGALQGFNLGFPLPSAAVSNKDYFVIAESAGGFTPPGGFFTTVTQGDWFISTGSSWQFLNVGYDPPYATTTVPGIIEIATDAETQTGTDATRAVTPASLSSRVASEVLTGIASVATQAETNAGVVDNEIVTPKKLFGVFSSGALDANSVLLNPVINAQTTVQRALNDAIYDVRSPFNTIDVGEDPVGLVKIDVVQATETQRGGGEIATQIETNAGTSDIVLLTPLKLAQYIASGQITAPEIPLSPSINGNTNVQDALADAIYDIDSPGATLSITETATGQVDMDVVQATEGQLGGAQIATDAETQALALDTVIVTPLKLGNLFASGAIDANDILLNPTINGNTDVQSALNDAIYDISSSDNSVTVAETAVGQIDLTVTQASETQFGGGEIATQAETDAGLSDTLLITPKKLAGYIASGQIEASEIVVNPAINGNTNVQSALNDAIYDVTSSDNSVTVVETATGQVDLSVSQATETQFGGGEIATQAETDAGLSDIVLVTPKKLAGYIASGQIEASEIVVNPTINGKTDVQSALADAIYNIVSANAGITVAEAATGQITLTFNQATDTTIGGGTLATSAEAVAGTNATDLITPSTLRSAAVYQTDYNAKGDLLSASANDTPVILSVGANGQYLKVDSTQATGLIWDTISADDILVSPAINGSTNLNTILNDAIYRITSPGGSVTLAETATGQVTLAVTQATETQLGGGEIATQAEADAVAGSASDTVLITPLKLANRTATETRTGIAELATQVETEAGTDDTRIVTPLKLRTAAVYKSDFNAKGDLLSASANDTPVILPVGIDGQVLTADSTTGTGLKWTTQTPASFALYNLDTFVCDGIASSFNLEIGGVAYTPVPSSNIMVFLGGVPQIPGAANAYTVAGSVITFTSVPPIGTTFFATTVK